MRLAGKVALVTGAALGAGEGIGSVTAVTLAAEGARVCCADIDLGGAEAAAAQVRARGGDAFAVHVDVGDGASNDAMVAAVLERYGVVHVAHLNAGITRGGDFVDVPARAWDEVIAVNLRGAFLGMQASARAMVAAGVAGSIVCTASAAGLVGLQTAAPYCASKFGIVGLVRSAAMDLAAHGIRVNAVCPGNTDTRKFGRAHGDPALRALLARGHALGRVGEPEDVARAVAFLASEDAASITGVALPVDGGLTGGMDPPWRVSGLRTAREQATGSDRR